MLFFPPEISFLWKQQEVFVNRIERHNYPLHLFFISLDHTDTQFLLNNYVVLSFQNVSLPCVIHRFEGFIIMKSTANFFWMRRFRINLIYVLKVLFNSKRELWNFLSVYIKFDCSDSVILWIWYSLQYLLFRWMSLQNYIVLTIIYLGKIAAIFWMHSGKKKKKKKKWHFAESSSWHILHICFTMEKIISNCRKLLWDNQHFLLSNFIQWS